MNIIDNVKLEVDIPTTLENILPNPGENRHLGGMGWISSRVGDAVSWSNSTGAIRFTFQGWVTSQADWFNSERFPVKPGQYVGGRIELGGGSYSPMRMHVRSEFFDKDDVMVGYSSTTTTNVNNTGTITWYQVPATAVSAHLRVTPQRGTFIDTPAGWLDVKRVSVLMGPTSASVDIPVFIPKHQWVDILGPATDIKISREAMNVGTLSATVRDATLDPATSGAIRQGKAVRVMAKNGGTWVPIFTGTIDKASTTYDRLGNPTITMTALDSMQRLANVSRPQGVSTVSNLRNVLEGSGVPWNFNGDSGHNAASNVVTSFNESSNAADQVALVRDTVLGHAWVDVNGVINGWDTALLPTAPVTLLDEARYSDLDVDFNSEECINSVIVTRLEFNPSDNSTEEVQHGPYENLQSIQKWGRRQATFTVSGLTEIQVQAYANSILAANAEPQIRINSMTLPVKKLQSRQSPLGANKATNPTFGLTSGTVTKPGGGTAPGVRAQGGAGAVYPASCVAWVDDNSMCIEATAGSSGVAITGLANGLTGLNMSVGKTYFISAKCRLEEVQNSPHSTARQISVGNIGTTIRSESAPNVIGTHKVSLIFTVPSGATNLAINLSNGGAVGQQIWWSDLVIQEVQEDVSPVFLDLCDLVTTAYDAKNIYGNARIQSVEHTITPKAWTVEVGFSAPTSVASPQQQPQINTDSAWLTPYGRVMRINSSQSIPTVAWTAIAFNTTASLTGGIEYDSTNNRFVVRKNGLYSIVGSVRWDAGAAGTRGAAIYRNGAIHRYIYDAMTSATLTPSTQVSTLVRLNAGDTIELRVYQSTGSNLTTISEGSGATALEIAWVGV